MKPTPPLTQQHPIPIRPDDHKVKINKKTCETCLSLLQQRKHLLKELIKPHITTTIDHRIIDASTNPQAYLDHVIQTHLYRELKMEDSEKGRLLKGCQYCVELHKTFDAILHLIQSHFVVQQDDAHFTCDDRPCTKFCFFSCSDLYSHWKNEHYITRNTQESADTRYICQHQEANNICKAPFDDFVQFKIHQLTHTSNRSIFKCSAQDCNLTFLTSAELDLHHNWHHMQQESSTT